VAATVTNQGTVANECDATTGWTPTPTLVTTDPDPVELTGCLGYSVSSATVRPYLTGTWNLSNKVLSQWYTHRASVDTFANGGVGYYVSDGTNIIVFKVAGCDLAAFRHDEGPSLWQCCVLDTSNPPASPIVVAGSAAALDWSAIVRRGWQFINTVKAVGSGVLTFFWDVMRTYAVGEGLLITGGSSSVPGVFSDIATADADTATLKGFGCFRKLGLGLYESQAPLNFGIVSADSWFSEDSFALVFPDRGFADDKYLITMVGGEGTYENHLVLTNGLVKSAAQQLEIDFSAANVTEIDLTGTVVETKGGPVTCATDAYAVAGHVYSDAVFRGCGLVTFGQCDFVGASILESAVAADASASKWNVAADPDGYLDDMTFTKGANAHHAIEFGTSSPTSITINGWTVTGFNAANGQNDSTFYVARTTGTVTINVLGSSGNFSYKSAGATVVVVVDAVTTQVTCLDANTGDAIEGVAVTLMADGTGPFPYEDSVTITRVSSTAYVAHTAHGLSTGDKVRISGAEQNEYNRIKTITVTGVDEYTFSVVGTPTTPATGTILATAVFLDEETPVSGIVSDSRVFSTSQAVAGYAARGTSSPLYKRTPLSGTINSGNGLSITAIMFPDE